MVKAAEEKAAQLRSLEDEFDDSDKPERKYSIKQPEKVLVRLKVEHSGFSTLNNQRFGSQFVGEVVRCYLFIVINPLLLSTTPIPLTHIPLCLIIGQPR